MNLDGETNMKLKHALEVTTHLHDEKSLQKFRAMVKCEDPNENMYSFIGTFQHDGKEYPLIYDCPNLQKFIYPHTLLFPFVCNFNTC